MAVKRVSRLLNRWSTDQLITGIETNDWLSMLKKNDFNVSPEYFHRLAWVTGWSLPSTAFGRIEDARYGRKLAAMEVDPDPIFILGHWRSGTTHLHNLIGRDPNHTYSTVFQVVFPSMFLTTEKFMTQITAGLLPETRTYDNVKHGWYEAAEDEIALAKLTGMSPYVSFMFPEGGAKYERYIDFLECTADEKRRWKESFQYLIKKIMLNTGGKRVIVKSCTHTARIRMILEMYPNAKFIFIHRNPYEVFSSTLHMRSHTDWENFFQVPVDNVERDRTEQTAAMGERIFQRVIEDRKLIPKENYFELRYDEFAGNEMHYLRQIYEQFDLPDRAQYEETISTYLEGLKGYKRNKLKIDRRLKDLVWDRWQFVFEEFGYPKEYQP